MRICVAHETLYRYQPPAAGVIQTLRLTPRNHAGQYVVDWRIDVSADCRLDPQEDAFGNIVHAFAADGPIAELRLVVEGDVETQDAAGVVRGAMERFPPTLFLRETPLTRADEAMLAYAAQFAPTVGRGPPRSDEPRAGNDGAGAQALATLHALLTRLHQDMAFEPAAAAADAAEAFARRRGPSRDFAHVFIALSRALGIPARFVNGYCGTAREEQGREAVHAWVEAHVGGLGWVGFDPAGGLCVADRHVRLAVGLDCLGAAPVRGAHYGGGGEEQVEKLTLSQASRQAQE